MHLKRSLIYLPGGASINYPLENTVQYFPTLPHSGLLMVNASSINYADKPGRELRLTLVETNVHNSPTHPVTRLQQMQQSISQEETLLFLLPLSGSLGNSPIRGHGATWSEALWRFLESLSLEGYLCIRCVLQTPGSRVPLSADARSKYRALCEDIVSFGHQASIAPFPAIEPHGTETGPCLHMLCPICPQTKSLDDLPI